MAIVLIAISILLTYSRINLLSIHHLPETAFFNISLFLKDLKKNMTTILHFKSLKKCHKNFENRLSKKKKFMPEIILNRFFFYCKTFIKEGK